MAQQFVQNPMNQFEAERLPVGWPWRFFMFAFIVFLASILVYLGLVFGYEPFLNNQINAVDQQISQASAVVPQADQNKFVQVYSQIINLQSLTANHVFASNSLKLLETVTDPQVYFTGATLKTDQRTLDLDGVAASFPVLAEQLEAFAESKQIDRYTLVQSQLNGGAVQFKVSLTLNTALLTTPQ